MWVDTHCHLDAPEFDLDRDAVVQLAIKAGMQCCVVPAVSAASFPLVKNCCARFSLCMPAYGIHPMYVNHARTCDLDLLETYLCHEQPVAVGEIGLDGTVTDQPGLAWDQQEKWFEAQLKLAQDYDLPVILHVRKAIDAVCKGLRKIRVKGGIAHAFNGSRQQADVLIGMGFKLGFGGAMTYSGSTRIQKLAKALPLDAIVLETDAPDIPPAWLVKNGVRGRNQPSELLAIAHVLAELREVSVAEICAATSQNALSVLNLPMNVINNVCID